MEQLDVTPKRGQRAVSTSTVTVASKLSMSLILRLYDKKTVHEPVLGGGSREVVQYQLRYGAPTYTVQGNSWAQNKGPHQQIVGGYALTSDIPKDFWDEWLSQNQHADYVVNGMIFASHEHSSAASQAREQEALVSGFERLDPNKLPNSRIKTATPQTV